MGVSSRINNPAPILRSDFRKVIRSPVPPCGTLVPFPTCGLECKVPPNRLPGGGPFNWRPVTRKGLGRFRFALLLPHSSSTVNIKHPDLGLMDALAVAKE